MARRPPAGGKGGSTGGRGGKGPGGKAGERGRGKRTGGKRAGGKRAGGKSDERGKRPGGKPGERWEQHSRAKPASPRASRPARPRGPRPVVAVFAKSPEPGRVKTRLSPALRPEEAADLSRALLLDTLDVVEAAGARVFVAFTPGTARRPLERLLGTRRRLLPQPPGDLGARLEGVIGMLQESGGKRVLVVGSDCPGLTSERVREAYRALENAPVVLGPALDGGFYLLGVSGRAQGLLRDIPWSTGRELASTRARLFERGLAVRELAEERDLDTPRDLFEWYVAARDSGLEARYPRTWKILHSLMTPRRFADLESRLAESP